MQDHDHAGSPSNARRRRAERPRLDVERVRSRVSAYVYGNVLVLAAVVGCAPESVRSGRAVVVVLATVVTTYLAHVVAHRVGESVGRSADDAETHLRGELRDALPIASSGVLPALVLALVALGQLDRIGPDAAQLVAALAAVVRLALAGVLTDRLVAGRPSVRALWSGLSLAVAGSVVAVLKVLLTH